MQGSEVGDNRGMPSLRPSLRPLHLLTTLSLVAALLIPSPATARTIDEVLSALEASAAALVDVSFVLDGVLIDEGGQSIRIEVEVLAIPGSRALGTYILRPDVIADNMIVIDGDVVRSYTFITHQTTLFNLDDPDAFAGLFEVPEGGEFPLDLNLAALFEGWRASLVGPADSGRGAGWRLRFDNLDPNAVIGHVLAVVTDGLWEPWTLSFYLQSGELFADLTFRDFQRDQGLSVAEVTYLPEDAETIDRRR